MAMQLLGDRIKKRREDLKISSADLATNIGVTASLISQIERAKSFPSILTLKKIADALFTTVGELIGESSSLIENPLLKQAERKFVKENQTGTKSYLLSHHDTLKQMDPFYLVFEKNADSSEIMTTKNPRQEFIYVVSGRFKVELNNHIYELSSGDSFYFISNQEHKFINIDAKPSEMIWVVNQNKTQ